MNNYEKIEKNICIFCEGFLKTDENNGSHKKCADCESIFWNRDDDDSWRMKKSDKLLKDEMSLEFQVIITNALVGSKTDGIDKETWSSIFNGCAEYGMELLNRR